MAEQDITLKIKRGTLAQLQAHKDEFNDTELLECTDKDVPIPTPADYNKVIRVNATGEYVLGEGGGGVDQTYDATSTKAQSGTAVAQAVQYKVTSDSAGTKMVSCTIDEYNAMASHDNDTYYNITDDNSASSAVYSKAESDAKYVAKATGTPTLTVETGWALWVTQLIPIGGNFYYLNITVRNDTGAAQGAPDYPIVKISGNPIDCALATACYEAPTTVIGCVIQTRAGGSDKVIKFRCGNGVIPAGAYIPISGVVQWTP